MLLQNKTAVIYGGAGAVGSAVARAFAREGAMVFLGGRTLKTLEAVAGEINRSGGKAKAVKVDALNKEEVEKTIHFIVQQTGRIDISFNLVSIGDVHGTPLSKMEIESFATPIYNAVRSHFITAQACVHHMQKQGSGVILALTANAARRPYENTGGFGVAGAAIEGICRQLAAEEGRHGIRVICLRSAGSPDAPGVDEVFDLHAEKTGVSREQFEKEFAERTMLKRLPRLAEVANAAVLMAADHASAITAAVANVTCGELAD
jgi:NAD(P)-dependent dehydrogenase (short-subunit alcohol dehydrogenase family)